MDTCIICRFSVELDDVVVRSAAGGCVCLGCYARETGNARPMPKTLRRQLSAVLSALEAAELT